MQRFYDVITDQFGNPANGVLVTVYDAATGTPSTLYRDSDNSLTATNVISNPFTTNASGIVAFAVANGQYTITYSGSSITPRTFTWLTMSDGATSSVPWGSITGTLASQTDLNTALGLKAPAANPTFTGSATFSFLTNTRVVLAGASGDLGDNANLTYTGGQLRIADTTASTSSTTGALRVDGGLGVGGDVYISGKLAMNQAGGANEITIGTITATGNQQISFNSASGKNQLVAFKIAGTTKWFFGINGSEDFLIQSNGVDNPFSCPLATGGQITLGSTSRPVSIAKTANAAEWIHGSASELLTIAAAASTDTTANLLPANAIIESVVVRVTTVIPTAATFSVGDATTAARFATGVAVAAGTTAVGLTHCDQTGAAGPKQTAAAKIRITPNVSPATATGVVRITVFYRQFTPPTS